MKKVLLTLVVAVVTLVGANAQFYGGGSFNLLSNSDEGMKSNISINSEVGYYINEKFDVGLDLGFSFTKRRDDRESSSWSIAPYARYSFFQLGKFEVIGKASTGFYNIDYDGVKSTAFTFNVSPILAYSLTEKVVLFTQLRCLSLNFTSSFHDGDHLNSSFNFGANTNNLINTENLQIGFIYKF